MKENKIFKRLLIFAIAAFMILSATSIVSAAYVEIGNPASTSYESYVPFYGFYDYGWSAVIYLQSELGSTKDLTGLTYDVYDAWTGSPYTIYDQKVYMKHTTLTDWVGDLAKPDPTAEGYTLVYEGDITFTATGFADSITLDTNFNYDGTSNLIIYWENWDGDYASGQPRWQYPGTSYAPNRVKYKYADNAMPGDATSASYYFPNIRIQYPGTHDVAVTDIVSPKAGEGYGNVPVTVEVKNTGLNTETFPVNVKINAPPVTILEESFEDTYSTRPSPPLGWAIEDTNGDGYISGYYGYNQWGSYSSSTYAHTGTMSMRCEDGSSAGNNDWLFTEPLSLTAGTTYAVDFWTRMSSSSTSYDNQLGVYVGTGQSSSLMSFNIWYDAAMYHTTHRLDTASFTVPVDGTYYIGFERSNGYSYADLYLDDVHLYVPGSAIYDQTVTMTNLGAGSTSEANLPDWNIASPGIYEVVADAQLATDVALYDNIMTKSVTVGFVDASVDSIDFPQALMGPAPFHPGATVNNTGDLDFDPSTVGLLPVHATVLDPSGGTGVCFEEDFEGATGFYEYEGDVVIDFNPDAIWKSGEFVGAPGYIQWPDDKRQFGDSGDWTILNPDNNGAMWHQTDYRSSPNSPTHSMYAGDENTKLYLGSSQDVMISPKIHVGPTGGTFSFDIYNDVEPGWDWVYFGASPDGISFAWYWFGPASWTTWMTGSGVPIPPSFVDANGDCYIGFMFLSDPSFNYEGVYIDHVAVQGSPYLYDETVYVELTAAQSTKEIEFPLFTPHPDYDGYTIDICCEHPDDTVPANDCDSLTFTTGAPVYILETGLGYTTIQDGIDNSEIGQTVVVTNGTYYEDVFLDRPIIVTGEYIESTLDKATCTYDHDHGTFLMGTVVIDAGSYVPPPPTWCEWEICLRDSYGDGWNGGMVDVLVNGVVVLDDITVPSGTGPICYTFQVDDYDSIEVIYTAGSYPSENYYSIYDNLGMPVVTDWQPYYDGDWTGTGYCADEPEGCLWEIDLYDDWGDGWNGGMVDVLVDGVVVLDDITLGSGSGPAIFLFVVDDGDSIEVVYTAGSYPYENYYDIYDASGSSVVTFWYPDTSGTWYGTGYCPITADGDEGKAVLEKFDINPPYTFDANDAAVKIYSGDVTVRKNTIHNVLGLVNETTGMFTIKGIHIYSGDPATNFTGILIQNNTIRDILNEGSSGGGGGDGIYDSDFESDDGDWVATATWDPVGDWEWTNSYNFGLYTGDNDPPTAAHSGSGLWGTVLYADYTNSGGETLLSQTFDFSGESNVHMIFWQWSDMFGDWDYGEVIVNGVQEYYVDDYPGTSWQEVDLDLSDYDGLSSVEIVFSMHASTVVNYAGWYIDDITIEGGPAAGNTHYGGATGVMAQGFLEGVVIEKNRIEDIHSAGWCYGVEYTPTNVPSFGVGAEGDILFYQEVDGGSDPDWSFANIDQSLGYGMYENFQLSASEPIGEIEIIGLPLVYSGGWMLCNPDDVELHIEFYDDPYTNKNMPTGSPVASFDVGPNIPNTATGQSYAGYPAYEWTIELPSDVEIPSDEGKIYITETSSAGGCLWGSSHDGDLWSYHEGAAPPATLYDRALTLIAGGGAGPVAEGNIIVNCNYFTGIGDGTVYPDVNITTSAPYPGVMFTVDEAAIPGPANASWVTLTCNYFDPDCNYPVLAVINKDLSHELDARMNYWGSPKGPGGGAQDQWTGAYANAEGFGANIVDFGQVRFDPWLGICANIKAPMGDSIAVEAGEPVMFDAEGSFAYIFDGCEECCNPIEQSLQYLWDFGDGMYSSNKAAAHVFTQPGTYQVSLMVDAIGFPYLNNFMYDWDYIEVVVTEAGAPLSANADGGNLGGYETTIEQPVILYGSATGGKSPYYYNWDFGDGTSTSSQGEIVPSTIQHTYLEEGTYTVTLTVMDSNFNMATDTSTVTVYGIEELVINIGGVSNIAQGDAASFTSTVSGGRAPYDYQWNFGDAVISTEANPIHVYENSGTYTVTLTVTDSRDNTKTKTKTVTVSTTDTSEVEITNVNGGLLLSATIHTADEPVDWSIQVDGIVLFGGQADGTVPANAEVSIKLPFTFGLGSVDITITASSVQEHYTATMIGPFVLRLQEA